MKTFFGGHPKKRVRLHEEIFAQKVAKMFREILAKIPRTPKNLPASTSMLAPRLKSKLIQTRATICFPSPSWMRWIQPFFGKPVVLYKALLKTTHIANWVNIQFVLRFFSCPLSYDCDCGVHSEMLINLQRIKAMHLKHSNNISLPYSRPLMKLFTFFDMTLLFQKAVMTLTRIITAFWSAIQFNMKRRKQNTKITLKVSANTF